MRYGRPLKSGSRRIPITIHAPIKTLEAIDEYVSEYAETSGTAYSRSDFYNEAAAALLRSKDIDIDADERNKSVTKKFTAEATRGNRNNKSKNNPENAPENNQ
ncbi:MAG: hypothetical protein LUD19_03300 [Clostridia bacterium]|nr:hypothetical protein [Clostridia bacterium]